MGRDYGYINISKPRILSPGLSHDLQLLRDLEIVNARTVAELGPLPPDGLPIVPKSKYIPPQSATVSAQVQANFKNQEEKAMKLNQMITVAALATGIAACEPSAGTDGARPSPAVTRIIDSNETNLDTPVPANASTVFNRDGKLKIEAGDYTLFLTTSECVKDLETLFLCNKNSELTLTKEEGDITQTLLMDAIHVNIKQIFYRGNLNDTYSGLHTFILSDVNGDDREDLIIRTGREGAYGGPSYSVYLFNKSNNQFEYSRDFSELTIGRNGLFAVVDGKIKTVSSDGCCLHIYETYELEINQPRLIERVWEDSMEGGNKIKITTEKLIHGELKKVDETIESRN